MTLLVIASQQVCINLDTRDSTLEITERELSDNSKLTEPNWTQPNLKWTLNFPGFQSALSALLGFFIALPAVLRTLLFFLSASDIVWALRPGISHQALQVMEWNFLSKVSFFIPAIGSAWPWLTGLGMCLDTFQSLGVCLARTYLANWVKGIEAWLKFGMQALNT